MTKKKIITSYKLDKHRLTTMKIAHITRKRLFRDQFLATK